MSLKIERSTNNGNAMTKILKTLKGLLAMGVLRRNVFLVALFL
jgi:hypothetical protein